MNSITCPKCAVENESEMSFCVDCGAPLAAAALPPTVLSAAIPPSANAAPPPLPQISAGYAPQRGGNAKMYWAISGGLAILGIVFIAALAVGGAIYFNSGDKSEAVVSSGNNNRGGDNRIGDAGDSQVPAAASAASNTAGSSTPGSSSSSIGAISVGIVNGKAALLVQPQYPGAAKAVHAGGAVNVQVLIDETGSVVEAEATSGHPLLRASAINAAKQSRFQPTILSGKAVKVTGVVTYQFTAQ